MKFIEPLWSISFCFKPIQQPQPPRRCILFIQDVELLEPEVQDLLLSAEKEVTEYGHKSVHTVHVLVALLESGCEVAELVSSNGVTPKQVRTETYGPFPKRDGEVFVDGHPPYAAQVQRAVHLVVADENARGNADLQKRLLLQKMMEGYKRNDWSPVIVQAFKRRGVDTGKLARQLQPVAA